MASETESQILDEPVAEARRVLAAAEAKGLILRVLGGVAVKLALGERLDHRFDRDVGDLDLICQKRRGTEAEQLLEELGWQPERQFNAINGARRMLFRKPVDGEKLDLFVGSFEMCHTIPLSERLEIRAEALAPADLLLTKLQIIELNAKDLSDSYALLLGFPVTTGSDGEDRGQAIELDRIGGLAAGDWGLFHTLELNFERLREGLGKSGLSDMEQAGVAESITAIERAMEDAPKSRGWKLRARVGERKRWYEEPAEIG